MSVCPTQTPNSKGGSLGALNHAIVVDQFERLRQGDAWWFERSGVLDAATLLEVQSTLFVDVVKRNTNLKNVQDNFFVFKTTVGGMRCGWVGVLVWRLIAQLVREHCCWCLASECQCQCHLACSCCRVEPWLCLKWFSSTCRP
jgi:hypothetical protein